MTRVGAIDCGTNSIRLLVADVVEPRSGGDGAATGSALLRAPDSSER